MSELSDIAALAVTLKIGGKKYTFTPMDLEAWAKADKWAEEQWFADMKSRADALKDHPELVKKIHDRMATIKKYELTLEAASYLDYGEGCAYTLYLQLQPAHPNIKIEECRKLVTSGQFTAIQKMLEPKIPGVDGKKEKAED